ncbi:MAG TPA: uracil-DNA glycosylase [Alphaproteobacteria bacterium]|nr:uracil-DNA glycosylase [Alphaproteobacteria bacterium]
MGTNSLRDLKLAGVKWELCDKTQLQKPKNETKIEPSDFDLKLKNLKSQNINQSIIPPVAPISTSSAKDRVKNIKSLTDFINAISNFDHPLRQFAKNIVIPHLCESSDLLIITDVPSGDDDDKGQIMTGRAGDLLDKMLSAIGLKRNNVSIIPLVFWRTPGGRTPAREEIDLIKPFISCAISLLKPKVIITMGTLPAAEIINAKLPKNHGEIIKNEDNIPVIPIYHPNYLILKPDTKRDVWDALQKLQNLLKNGEI